MADPQSGALRCRPGASRRLLWGAVILGFGASLAFAGVSRAATLINACGSYSLSGAASIATDLDCGAVPGGLHITAFVAYLLGLLWAERRRAAPMTLVWGAAIIFRLLLLLTPPTLSDDVYRYLWDGYVANHGVSPYAYPIDSPELDYLDNPLRSQANHRWMASPYLPAAQFLFISLTRLFPLQPLFLQMAMVVFDLT